MEFTLPIGALSVLIRVPLSGFHIFIVESVLPLARKPFFSTTSVITQSLCPVRFLNKLPVSESQIFITLSAPPLASLPLGNTVNDHKKLV